MSLIKTCLFLQLLLCLKLSNAQQEATSLLDENSTSATGTTNAADYAEMLEHYLRHPLNLNLADRGALFELHLLTPTQIHSIIGHRLKYGPLLSVYELQSIPGLDVESIKKILPYITVEENTLTKTQFRKLLHGGENTLVYFLEVPLQKPQGFLNASDSIQTNDYLGSNFKTNIRYRYSNGSRMSMGFNADKDIGEPFFNKVQRKGFDFYSAHFFLQNSGTLRQLAIGDYHLSIGQGLGIGSGFVLNKSIEVLQVHRYAAGLRPYRSMNEYGFFRGAAATLGTEKRSCILYASVKKTDGNTLVQDTALFAEERYYNLIQTGNHRTVKELALKNTSIQKVFGGYLQTQWKRLHAGIGGVYHETNRASQWVHSDFNYEKGNAIFFGEGVLQDRQGKALLLGCMTSIHKNLDLVMIYRNYNTAFMNPLSNAFSNASTPNNENGVYTGVTLKLTGSLRLLGYADVFNSPMPGYRKNGSTHGYDNAAAVQYQQGKSFKLEFRYRINASEVNVPASLRNTIGYLIQERRSTLRMQADYSYSKQLIFRTRVEQTGSQNETGVIQRGNLIFQDIHYKTINGKFGAAFRYCLFSTKGSNARIYAFENDVPYTFSVSQMSGTGSHFYIMVNYRYSRRLDLWLRFSDTYFPDETQLGSGLDKIAGNTKENFKLLLKLHF